MAPVFRDALQDAELTDTDRVWLLACWWVLDFVQARHLPSGANVTGRSFDSPAAHAALGTLVRRGYLDGRQGPDGLRYRLLTARIPRG